MCIPQTVAPKARIRFPITRPALRSTRSIGSTRLQSAPTDLIHACERMKWAGETLEHTTQSVKNQPTANRSGLA